MVVHTWHSCHFFWSNKLIERGSCSAKWVIRFHAKLMHIYCSDMRGHFCVHLCDLPLPMLPNTINMAAVLFSSSYYLGEFTCWSDEWPICYSENLGLKCLGVNTRHRECGDKLLTVQCSIQVIHIQIQYVSHKASH